MTPYDSLPDHAFWRLAVAERDPFDANALWTPKFEIQPNTPVATYGSCFAQNIGRYLLDCGFHWLRTESPPFSLSKEKAKKFYYEVFSARTGNIYTTTLLHQWVSWATDETEIPEEVWEQDGRFYDPFRPVIEPNGFASNEEAISSRNFTVHAFRRSIEEAEVLVFTLGLTERWYDKFHGFEYPICPGVAAGCFNRERHLFANDRFGAVKHHLESAVKLMRGINPALKILLTVSPVPLTATQSGHHVVVANMKSKSVLRAVAADLAEEHTFIDYFPSYEIISSPAFRGIFFGPNQRTVTRHGIAFVMKQFSAGLNQKANQTSGAGKSIGNDLSDERQPTRDRCEEELLNAFGSHR